MKRLAPTPPRWAEAILRSLLRPSDRESISGDLLEEYRAAKRPVLGKVRSNAWYIKQVLSMLLRLVCPCALVVAALTVVLLTLQGINVGYGSLLPAPGLSLAHVLVYLWAGYHGSRRTRLIKTGMLTAGVTGALGVTAFFGTVAATRPGLIVAPFSTPFIFVILSIYLLLGLSYGMFWGGLGGVIGKFLPPGRSADTRAAVCRSDQP
jgi:hypothetical protein